MKISENTNIGLPLRNLIGLVAAIVMGAWFAFGVIERLKNLEMFMLIEHLAGQIEDIEKEIQASRYNKVNIDHLKEQVDALQKQIDKLRNGGH